MTPNKKVNELIFNYLKRIFVPKNIEKIDIDMKYEKYVMNQDSEDLLSIKFTFKNGAKFEVSGGLYEDEISLSVPKRDLIKIGALDKNQYSEEGDFEIW